MTATKILQKTVAQPVLASEGRTIDTPEPNFIPAQEWVYSSVMKVTAALDGLLAGVRQQAKQSQKIPNSKVPKKCRGGAKLFAGPKVLMRITEAQCVQLCDSTPHFCMTKKEQKAFREALRHKPIFSKCAVKAKTYKQVRQCMKKYIKTK